LGETVDVLVVCTGNICRSPTAAALLGARLAALGVPARVTSAGTVGEGAPAWPEMVAVAAEVLGLDLSAHRSRVLGRADVEGADLVIGMAREHLREAVLLVPEAWHRTFTLKEMVRRGRATGPRPPDVALDRWLALLAGERPYAGLLGGDPADDVPDPLGADRRTLVTAVQEIDRLVAEVVRLAWPPAGPT
jgi:protein-tyrosine phosphatase